MGGQGLRHGRRHGESSRAQIIIARYGSPPAFTVPTDPAGERRGNCDIVAADAVTSTRRPGRRNHGTDARNHGARARLEAGEYFDGLAETEKDLKPAQLIAAADYANHVAEQLREVAAEIRAEERARREAKRAEREERRAQQWHTLPDGTLQRLKGSPA